MYSGPRTDSAKRTSVRTVRKMYEKGEPIVMITAYDYPSAVHVSTAPQYYRNAAHAPQ